MSTGVLPKSGSRDLEVLFVGRDAHDGERAALALAERAEEVERLGGDGEDVALLRLVRPDLARGHPRLLVGRRPQVDAGPAPRAVDELRQRVREAARPHVVDGEDGVRLPEGPAAVDDLLGPALDLRVAPLDGVEVEIGGVGARGHRGRRAAPQADEHPGAADLDEEGPRPHLALVGVGGAHVADAARDHDRLVVAAHDARHLLLVGAEVAGEVGAAELVVEGGRPDRSLDHDREGRGDAVGSRLAALPRPLVARGSAGWRRRSRRGPPWAWRPGRSPPRRGSRPRNRWPRRGTARSRSGGCASRPS